LADEDGEFRRVEGSEAESKLLSKQTARLGQAKMDGDEARRAKNK